MTRQRISLLFLVLFFPTILASETLPTIQVGIDRAAAPMEFERNSLPDGFNIEIMQAIAKRAGFIPKFIFLNWTNVLESVKTGRIDLMFAMKTSDREKLYKFGKPFLDINVRIFVRENIFGISRLADLEGRTVATVRGFACNDALAESGLQYRIISVESVDQALDLLANGDVFAFVGQYHLVRYALQKKNRPVKSIGESVRLTPFSIAGRPQTLALINRLDQALDSIKRDGEYDKIYEKWYGGSIPERADWVQHLALIMLILLAVVLILGAWGLTLRRQVRLRTRELLENLEKFRKFTDQAPFPVVILLGKKIEYLNPQFTKTFGYTIEDIPDTASWFSSVYPDPAYREAILREWNDDLTSQTTSQTILKVFDLTTHDGQTIPIEFRMFQLDDGRNIIILEDISLQRRLENERLRQEQLESISLLAGGIAHDFNNILMHLLGHINLLQINQGLPEDQRESLSSMEHSIQRAQDITSQLLTFSRGGSPVKKFQAIAPIIRESLDFVLHGSNCSAKIDIPHPLPSLDIDGGQIAQTLNNLVINAVQAMPQGGVITVNAQTLNREQAAITREDVNATLWVSIKIRDQGVGIPEEIQSRIFSPYYTSKENGTGLGLTTAYSIIRKHGGEISFSSTPGEGTTFTILLPVTSRRENDMQIVQNSPSKIRFSGRVIIMDDEKQIREILARMLEHLGLHVTATSSSEELVQEYMQAHDAGQPYDLVITDLTVPGGMGGRDALAILRKASPKIRAIVSSGFSSDPVLADCTAWGFTAALVKPYTLLDLEKVLASVFNQQT